MDYLSVFSVVMSMFALTISGILLLKAGGDIFTGVVSFLGILAAGIILLSMTGCGAHTQNWTNSAYGVTHYGMQDDTSRLEHCVVASLVREAGFPMKKSFDALGAVNVHWVDAPWTGSDGLEWQGVTNGSRIQVVRGNYAAYRHELTHFIGMAVYATPDATHKNTAWFKASSVCVGQ